MARVADIIDAFLSWSKIHRSEETNRDHIYYGQRPRFKQFEKLGLTPATECLWDDSPSRFAALSGVDYEYCNYRLQMRQKSRCSLLGRTLLLTL